MPWARRDHLSLGIVRCRGRRGSPGRSCAPGWPGAGPGRDQFLAGGDQLPGSPDRVRYSPGAHWGGRRVRAADARPPRRRRLRHGARRGTQRAGQHGSNAGRGAGLVAAAARDRGPVTAQGDAGPGSCVPGCEPCCVGDGSRPGRGQSRARLQARPQARQASSLLSPDRRVPQDQAAPSCRAAGGPGREVRSAGERRAATLLAGWAGDVRVQQGAAGRARDRIGRPGGPPACTASSPRRPATAVPGIIGDETGPGSSAPSFVTPSGTMALRHAEAPFLRALADQRRGSFSRTYQRCCAHGLGAESITLSDVEPGPYAAGSPVRTARRVVW